MIIALSMLVVALGVVLLISHLLERAPEAFEDENGFHILAQDETAAPGVAAIPRAGEVVG